jgi:methylated-DNA-[protein]-cysteine S-methyltransferase
MELKQRYIETPLGWMKLIQLDAHITATVFQNENPVSVANDETGLLYHCASEFQRYFNGELNVFGFLKNTLQTGTVFQQRVWKELCNIPFGETISYLQLAKKLGDEKTIRAAASANGQNNIAIAVPCHRVIGSDGSLTGYAGGLWRKKWLLDHEAKYSGKATQASLFG